MDLHNQIKQHRKRMGMSQEELAERIYVTRQTISNWENDKNYPDIHSLLLLSTLFQITLDQLVKGDITMMKQEINALERKQVSQNTVIFTCLLLISILTMVPFSMLWGYYGLALSMVIWGISLYYACKVEKFKKAKDIQTYKEIVSFYEGTTLDEIYKAKESGKRSYQKLLAVCIGAVFVAVIAVILILIFR